MAQVFISYSRKDLPFVEKLVSDLKETGVDVWYDLSGLEGGSRWGVEIRKAIKNSDYVIVVLSPDSVESEWVEREYLFSGNQKKKILPIMYRECEIPLSFLNLNYIDVQGENYSRNFEKIKRFLNREPALSSAITSSEKKYLTIPEGTPRLYAGLGILAALAVLGIFLIFNASDGNTSPEVNGTELPVETLVQSTPSSESTITPVAPAATLVPPTATVTEPPSIPDTMVTADPTQVDVAGQSAFIQTAGSANMSAHWTTIKDPRAADPNMLMFAMPNFNTPGSIRGVYNNHPIAVWYIESQWAILNQDMGFMPHDAAFNVQILEPGPNVFLHQATSSNIEDSWTVIDHPLASDPNALVVAMPNWSPPDGSMRYNFHPIAVWYTGTHWAIFNQDLAPMREGAAFNVQIVSPGMNAFVHTATDTNTLKNWTALDHPLAYDASKLVFAMLRSTPGDEGVYNRHPMGVWHDGTRWGIFNQDASNAMPLGAEFNVLILDPD